MSFLRCSSTLFLKTIYADNSTASLRNMSLLFSMLKPPTNIELSFLWPQCISSLCTEQEAGTGIESFVSFLSHSLNNWKLVSCLPLIFYSWNCLSDLFQSSHIRKSISWTIIVPQPPIRAVCSSRTVSKARAVAVQLPLILRGHHMVLCNRTVNAFFSKELKCLPDSQKSLLTVLIKSCYNLNYMLWCKAIAHWN